MMRNWTTPLLPTCETVGSLRVSLVGLLQVASGHQECYLEQGMLGPPRKLRDISQSLNQTRTLESYPMTGLME